VTLLAGVTVFMLMQRHAEQLLDKSLQSSLQNRVRSAEAEIRASFAGMTLAATRPRFIDLVQRLNTDAGDVAARSIIKEVALSFLPAGLNAIAVFGKDGRELARAGTFAQTPALAVPLHLPGRVQLLWDGHLVLHATLEMKEEGQVVGQVMAEALLPVTTSAFKDASRLGETGELALCAPFGVNMQCFPTTLNPNVTTTPRVAANGDPLPMAHALAGKTDFVSTQDYRHRDVEAAYAPIGDLGLGMVLKADSADLYATIWAQLRYLVPLLLGVLVIALVSLRWLISPLVLRLVQSEARIAGLNTELEKRVELRTAQLQASNRDLQEFAYSVAHDLRQPFIAIGGFSGLLERSVEDDASRHYIKRIQAGVQQAGALTDALLEVAHLSHVELRMQEVDLSALAHREMDKLRKQDPARVVSIHIQEGLKVHADKLLMQLVLHELLANAWKFTSRQNRTEIRFAKLPPDAGAVGGESVYVVKDNGEGFDMAHADKLFRSFQRLHADHDFPGLGVDLVKVQRIVARHHGRVWAESAVGEGASFFFTLDTGQP
jgi:signal transduction histidine kinase